MTSRLDRISQQRQEKLDKLRALGVNPYPNRFHRTHTAQQAVELLKQKEEGKTQEEKVIVAGRIMAIRRMGKASFADLRDGSGKIQLLFHADQLDEKLQEVFKLLDIGDIIGVEGTLLRTKTGEATVKATSFSLLTKSLQPLPEKWHGLSDVEIRYRQRYVDLISNPPVQELFKVRSKVIAAIRQFLNQRGFIEAETPVLQPAAGGALAKPFVTHYHALDEDFCLRISLELPLKRLIVGGLDKVYELGRVFRNEGIDAKHNPEFTLLESYEAYADYNDMMKMVEEMVSTVAQQVLGKTQLEFNGQTINLAPPWPRISLRDAVSQFSGIDFVKFPDADSLRSKMKTMNIAVDPKKNWARLVDDLIGTFVEPKLMQPTFLVDYPLSMSPLAKNKPGEERVVERFEGFAGGMEIANAFTELNDPLEQRARFEVQQKEKATQLETEEQETVDEDFLLALEYGMPPTGGLGVGIDRLVMLLTNQQSIREVILFPQLKEKQ